jgi:anaphase-promoting complex subunit 8
VEEISTAYENDELDAFGLYVYGLILKEAQKESLLCPHEPHIVLVECLLEFPFNWSAWLDLCEVVVGQDTAVEQQVEQALQPTLATHYMYHFFCAHLMAHHHQAYEDALVLFERLYEPLPDQPLFQSTYLKTQLAVVHYHLREMEQAQQWFQEALYQDRYSLDHKDVYSNILYVKEDRVGLSHLAHEAVVIDKYRPETCCIIGNYYSLKQNRQKAVLYFQRALKLDRTYTSAWTLMGHEYFELKQTESAMEAYRRAVNVSPKDYRAWYGLGQTYEFLNMHLYALYYYRKAAMLRPYDSRMWCAVGQCFAALHKVRDAIRSYERAVAQEDTEGIATQKLAALYRQEGRQEEAAQCYLRHLELRYLVTCVSPSNNPTLDDIVQGVVLETVEAEAFLFLAQYHKTHHEYETAALLCSRLVEYPGPEKEQAKGLLRDLRSRGRRHTTRSGTTAAASPGTATAGGALDPMGGRGGTDSGGGGGGGGGGIVNTNSPFQFSP